MPKWLKKLGEVVWTAVFALVFALGSLVAGIAGASIEVVLGFGFYALVMAILTPKS